MTTEEALKIVRYVAEDANASEGDRAKAHMILVFLERLYKRAQESEKIR